MTTGAVSWFNAAKGYGFIQRDDGGPDVFVHIKDVERSGIDLLRPGDTIEFEIVQRPSEKPKASNLRMTAASVEFASKPGSVR